MALCPRCIEPIGLIHRCQLPQASAVSERPAADLARSALMMADAGYDVDPVTLRLAEAYLALSPSPEQKGSEQ